MPSPYQLVLLRHGESDWNKRNLFTGWRDVRLSDRGIEEARESGLTLSREAFEPDLAFTSVLARAIKTLWLALEEMDRMWIPVT
ncbi:MAG TPA: 2,3-bisphosphoglycerate-dependent phosphoglycerate mutase, partial [Rhizomicrobium sp.]|nr:2,3-bisphosphoglycerate-dependent phosphoglycerate mutase [Rhizomicrobium sp.]